ncbi:hypothetical protein HOC80_03525 [archaeon]|jgi:hypothetical protein|nr:hypothetical protein [archaeon]MBT4417147.1 hypothetical protein [archaeon]
MNADEIFCMVNKTYLTRHCRLEDSQRVARAIVDAIPSVSGYCDTYSTRLSEIVLTTENQVLEPIFVFHDRLGGYTIEGVRASL